MRQPGRRRPWSVLPEQVAGERGRQPYPKKNPLALRESKGILLADCTPYSVFLQIFLSFMMVRKFFWGSATSQSREP